MSQGNRVGGRVKSLMHGVVPSLRRVGRATWGKTRAASVSVGRFVAQHVVLSLLIGVLTTYLVVYLSGPSEYVVYVVGDFSSDNQIAADVWRGLQDTCADRKLRIDGRSEVFETLNDQGEPERARRLAESLVASDNALMVIGHMLTQQSIAALPIYLGTEPPLPVLLTTETHPDILPPLPVDRSFHPVFRLSPDDEQQAEEMFHLAKRVRARRYWIAEDSANAVYSEFLAQQLDGRIVGAGGEVMLRTPSILSPDQGYWEAFFALATGSKLQVDALLYAGAWSDAVHALQQLQRLQPDSLVAVLGDLAAHRKLLDLDDSISGKIFLTHPLRAAVFEEEGYAPFGHDACLILQRLLVDVRQTRTFRGDRWSQMARMLRLTKVEDARESLAEMMERKAFTREKFAGMKLDESYGFDHLGRRENARFHHWRIYNGKFQQVAALASEPSSEVARQASGAGTGPPCRIQPRLIRPRALPLGRPPTIFGDRVQLEWRGFEGAEVGTQVYEVRVSRIADGVHDAREATFQAHAESLELEVTDWAGRLRWQVTAEQGDEQCTSEESELYFFPGASERLATTRKLRFGIPTANDGSFISMTGGDLRGFEVDLAREIAKKLGVEPVFYSYPWESLFWIPSKNEVDVIMGRLSIRPYRETDFGLRFSVPYFQTSQAMISRAVRPVTDVEDLADLRVIVPRATTSEGLAKALVNQKLITDGLIKDAANMEEGLDWLRSGQGEVLLADHAAALDLCQERALDDELQVVPVTNLPEGVDLEIEEPYGFALRSSDRELAERFDGALCELLEKRQVYDLLRRWKLVKEEDFQPVPAASQKCGLQETDEPAPVTASRSGAPGPSRGAG